MDSNGGTAWVAINTQPHREHIAIEHLQRQEFKVYCPLFMKRIRHARRAFDAKRPLFPGYLFVEVLKDRSAWRPILSTIGVRTLVRCGDQLSYVDNGFIESLRARELDGVIARPDRAFNIGQQVRMAGGPFDGLVATIIEMDDRERLTVLMAMLNGQVKVKVGAENIGAL